jgi:hypothetical protein
MNKITLDTTSPLLVEIDGKTYQLTLSEVTDTASTVSEKTTIVTGLWDIHRDSLSSGFGRSYAHYKEKFAELLKTPANLYIYVAKEDEEFVWSHRSRHNTVVKIMELAEFRTWFEGFDQVQKIRNIPEWQNQAAWLSNSPQAKLEYYNPVVMSKMFLLNNVTLTNPFESEYFYWIDAGITNTVHAGYFYHDKVFDNLPAFTDAVDSFTFLTYPYEDGVEIHGFSRSQLTKFSRTKKVNYVCRGGFFGGKKEHVNKINAVYYDMLYKTLNSNYMGTEESIFTILAHLYESDIYKFELESDGLVWPFFEKLKFLRYNLDKFTKPSKKDEVVNLYVLGFNSPEQFKTLCESIMVADIQMFEHTRKYLINNSTDTTLFEAYDELCERFNFEELHFDNLGVCGGRQFVAEHFDESNADFYIFFEDDMMVNTKEQQDKCSSGFDKYVENLYTTALSIIKKEELDLLKFSFSEFFGNNGVQWAWYNVPQDIRTQYWPEYDTLPQIGLDENAPKTVMYEINIENRVPYAVGEIYYSNWPQIVSRQGNKKIFLNTKWKHPYEQTWMSYVFQLLKKHELKNAVLLASPITHNRFEHYDGSLRKES